LDSAGSSTIAGLATGTPDGGVAIIRISGPEARRVAAASLAPGQQLPAPRRAGLRALELGEQALVLLMPGPASFTGEDVVELQIHAGARNVEEVLALVLRAGAEAAGPGDFSRRAFANGRLSLDQAEGIAALIGARTQAALDQARRLVAGELGREVEAALERLSLLRVEVEANLDFPDDVSAADEARFAREAGALEVELRRWLGRFEQGRRARARARVVLAGPPNAGKSALFNALLGQRRALVSTQAGTTRDYVEAEVDWVVAGARAQTVTLVDTAGLRAGAGEIEEAGVALSYEQIAGAEVVLWVEGADSGEGEDPADLGLPEEELRVLRVENKADLGPRRAKPWISVSADTGAGLEELRAAILEATGRGDPQAQWIGLARHHDRALEAAEALAEARMQLEQQRGLELVAFALAQAEARLGEITGRTKLGPVGEDVLHAIFAGFCIGK